MSYTRSDRREKHEWRKCVICGRFISYADLDNAKTYDRTNVTDWEPRDPEYAHRTCADKEKAQIKAWYDAKAVTA